MRIFYDKLIILLFSLLCFSYKQSRYIVITFLIASILSFLFELLDKNYKKYIHLFYIILLVYNQNFIYYLPLFLYDLSKINKILVYLLAIFTIKFSPFLFLINILAIYLATSTYKYECLKNKSKSIRDNLTEEKFILNKANLKHEAESQKNLEIALLDERNRISRNLHDSIGHLISSSIIQLEALSLVNKDRNIDKSLNTLQSTLKNGMSDIRSSIHNLYYESLNLEQEIDKLINNTEHLDIKLNYQFTSEDVELHFDILSIVKEAILNTSKHSDANTINIDIVTQASFHKISIKDNGSKSIKKENSNKGIGLLAIKEISMKYNGIFNYNYDNGFNMHISLMKGVN